jgi:Tfp pilus assembly PilM family ATPase
MNCGTRNSIAERFCSHCGSDLHALVDAALRALDERLEQAAVLEQDGRLLEAADCLAELPAGEHSQLASRREAAAQRRSQLNRQRHEAVAKRDVILAEANRLRGECQYAEALTQLEQVPASLRDRTIRTLHTELTEKVQLIHRLRRQLQESRKSGQIDELLPAAEQLLELEPHAVDVRRVCEQLRRRRDERDAVLAVRLLAQAHAAITKNEYRTAEAFIGQIALSIVEKLSADHRKLLAGIEERVWLARQIRVAPYADRTLLAVSSRLAKLQPKDAQAGKWQQEAAARLANAGKSTIPSLVPWAVAMGHGPLGAPVSPIDMLPQFELNAQSIQSSDCPSGLRRHLVAIGLALQGIGASRLEFELKPKDGSSWLNRLTEGRRRAGTSAWGLDFGTSGLKVARLVRREETVAIDRLGFLPYGDELPAADPSAVQPRFAEALRTFLDQFRAASEPLVLGFPGTQSLGRFFRLPHPGDDKLLPIVEYEARNHIPLPLDEVVFRTHVWGSITESGASHKSGLPLRAFASGEFRDIALIAAKRTHVDLRLSPFNESKSRVASLQSDCVALANVLYHSHHARLSELAADEAIVLIEIGDVATNVVAISPMRGLWFRSMHRGIRSLNQLLVRVLGLTWEKADRLRQEWAGPPPLVEVDRALMPGFAELTREVQQTLRSFQDSMRLRIARIYVAGGGCDQFGLLRDWIPTGEAKLCHSRGEVTA